MATLRAGSSSRWPLPHRGDLVAGVTVALVLVPQSLAYAVLAGMPPVNGLYAAAVAPLLAGLVGSSPYLSTGPAALTSLLVLGALAPFPDLSAPEYVAHAGLLALVVGVCRVTLGLVRGGGLAYLMSQPVVVGFTVAAAVLIATSQLPTAVGTSGTSDSPLLSTVHLLDDVGAWSWAAVVVTAATFAGTLLARRVHPLLPGGFLVGVLALLVVRAGWLDQPVVGDVPSGLPSLTVDLPWSALPSLLVPGLVIALVGFAEPAAIARRYASADRTRWDPDRELVGQGLANLGAAVTGGFAVGGSFSRSSLNRLSGARTRWSGVVSGALVLAFLPVTGVLSGLPTAVLAGLVLAAMVTLLDPRPLLRTWRHSRPQFAVALVTAVVCLAAAPRVQWGVIAGVGLALAIHLWRERRLDVDVWDEHDLLHVRPQGVLYFGSAPALETRVLRELADRPNLARVEIHLQRLGRVDLTGALVLRDICRDLAAASVPVVLSGAQPPSRRLLAKVLAGEDVDHTHGPRNTVSPAHPRLRERPTSPVDLA